MKHILYFAVATIAICLMTPAALAQRSDLDLRFHAPFPFSVGNNTFAASDYMINRQEHLKLIFCNQENHTATFVGVLPASSKDGNGHARVSFIATATNISSPLYPKGRWTQRLACTLRRKRRNSQTPALRSQ